MEQFRRAAAQTMPRHLFRRVLPSQRLGVPRNDAEAMKWMRRSADMNHSMQYYMGKLSEAARRSSTTSSAAHMWYSPE